MGALGGRASTLFLRCSQRATILCRLLAWLRLVDRAAVVGHFRRMTDMPANGLDQTHRSTDRADDDVMTCPPAIQTVRAKRRAPTP